MNVFKVAAIELKYVLYFSDISNLLHNVMHVYVMNIVVYSC